MLDVHLPRLCRFQAMVYAGQSAMHSMHYNKWNGNADVYGPPCAGASGVCYGYTLDASRHCCVLLHVALAWHGG